MALRHGPVRDRRLQPGRGGSARLAWIHHSYEDDLSEATATAEHQAGPERWHVSLRILGEF
ncbi:hypothetical protein AB0M32_51390 [Streptomyces sp. NPDC051985]|uniref:hypothetical protein n=1 Tax=Streptomyces sp. NPDC051985 TaxID=3155807 RepID=UPI00341B0F56